MVDQQKPGKIPQPTPAQTNSRSDIGQQGLNSAPDLRIQTPHHNSEVASQLKTLKELKDLGILTEEEYEQKRKKLVEHL